MTKDELIEELKLTKGSDEILICIVPEETPYALPELVEIDFVGGQFINITFPKRKEKYGTSREAKDS